MYKKLYILILFYSFMIIFIGCGKKISFEKISNDKPTPTIVPNSNETNKLQIVTEVSNTGPTATSVPKEDGTNKFNIEFDDYYHKYNGYIDQVALFDNKYDNQDYDGDGLNDRIYRRVFEIYKDGKYVGMKTNYRIDFGNGDKLEIGDFDDIYTGIQLIGFDLTGDGVNEIIFCGKHEVITFQPSGSEIAVYQKKDNSYEMMPLPRQENWSGINKYEVGLNFYKLSMEDNKVTIYSPDTNYVVTLNLADTAIEYFQQISGQIGNPAWRVSVTKFDNVPILILYNHIGSKFYDKDIATYLTWENGYFYPLKMELLPTYDDNTE